jgi:hypothetical protein
LRGRDREEDTIAYEELGSVRGIVDLTPQEALDSAEAFLTSQGYTVARRAGNSLTLQRRSADAVGKQDTPRLTIAAVPQPSGGVRVTVRGDDREGMQAYQAAWTAWSEGLPKKPDEQAGQAEGQQSEAEAHEVPLTPPPTVEAQNLPPAPQPPHSYAPPPPATQRSGMGTGAKLALGGCIGLVLLSLLTVGGCFALVANVEPTTDSESGSSEEKRKSDSSEGKQKSGSSKGEQSAVRIGESVTVGDVTWRVNDARQTNQLTQQGVSKQFAKTEQGNFVIIDFDFTNNGSDPVTLDNASLALIDSQGRESDPSSDQFFYVPDDRQIFLENTNPGITKQGTTIFEVAQGASGFQLQAGDTNMWSDENAYVDLGF